MFMMLSDENDGGTQDHVYTKIMHFYAKCFPKKINIFSDL